MGSVVDAPFKRAEHRHQVNRIEKRQFRFTIGKDHMEHELMTERAKKAFERGIITAEEAYRVSAEDWLQKGDQTKVLECLVAADFESEK